MEHDHGEAHIETEGLQDA